ncbi:unnamed protein product [Closterium sp. NIES-54]
MELLVFDDGPSIDQSRSILEANRSILAARGIALKIVDERTDAAARQEWTHTAALDKQTNTAALKEQTDTTLDSWQDSQNGFGDCRNTDNVHRGSNDEQTDGPRTALYCAKGTALYCAKGTALYCAKGTALYCAKGTALYCAKGTALYCAKGTALYYAASPVLCCVTSPCRCPSL